MAGSRALLDARAAQGGGPLAVNVDIDNTALATDYTKQEPVRPVRRFARQADALGMAVFFNTARPRGDGRLRRVGRVLRAAGFPVSGICGKRPGERKVQSKQRCRQRFIDRGYTLVVNVGNRRTDFVGGGYEHGIRLPSYGGLLR
jgi:hypothetical protein